MNRLVLRVLIASVAVSAAVGIFVLVTRDFDSTGGRTLATVVTISASGLLVMANGAAWDRGRLNYFPLAGTAVALATLPVLLVSYWTDFDAETLWKSGVRMLFASVYAAYVSLASIPRLQRRYWLLRAAAYAAGLAVTVVLTAMLWNEWTSAPAWRTVGVLGILVTALTVSMPLLRRMGDIAPGAEAESADARVNFCPNCGLRLSSHAADSVCPHCGARYRIEFPE